MAANGVEDEAGRPGAGAEWGKGPTLYLFGCDVKDYKVVIKHALSGDTVIGDIVPKASAAKVSSVTWATAVLLTARRHPAGSVRRRRRARCRREGP